MEVNNPLYKNIGIHVICSLFTIDKGMVKVLLIKRRNEPYRDKWALVGGALYNNETVEAGLEREIFEKTGLRNVKLYLSGVESEIDRSPLKRMVAINYIGLIDRKNSILKETKKTSNALWFDLNEIDGLAYDHEKILKAARKNLKELVTSSNALRVLFPNGFSMPELQRVYEGILEKQLDRRNFRKKMLSLGIIKETDRTQVFLGKKPAKVYIFNDSLVLKDIF